MSLEQLGRLRRWMAHRDHLEVEERELVEQVIALQRATDRDVRRSTHLTRQQALGAAERAQALGGALAGLVVVRQRRSALDRAIGRLATGLRRELARRQLKGT